MYFVYKIKFFATVLFSFDDMFQLLHHYNINNEQQPSICLIEVSPTIYEVVSVPKLALKKYNMSPYLKIATISFKIVSLRVHMAIPMVLPHLKNTSKVIFLKAAVQF